MGWSNLSFMRLETYISMNKPIGATQHQLDEHNIEWVLCGGYNISMNKEPQKWALRHSSEYEWAKERTMLLQEIANLKRINKNLEDQIDADYYPNA